VCISDPLNISIQYNTVCISDPLNISIQYNTVCISDPLTQWTVNFILVAIKFCSFATWINLLIYIFNFPPDLVQLFRFRLTGQIL